MPHTIGSKTKSIITYGPEAHKLFLEFGKETATVIEPGVPVIMDVANVGLVKQAPAGGSLSDIVGYAVTGQNHTAYGTERVTIACRGYVVIHAEAAGTIPTGPVELSSITSEGVVVVTPTTSPEKTIGIAITSAAAGEEISVMML